MPGNEALVVTQVVSGDLWAGAEVQVYQLCRALASRNELKVTAVVFNEGTLNEKLEGLGIPVTLADERKLGPMSIARAIASHCKRHGTEVVHTHGFKENVLGILGKEMAQVRASVRTVHGNPETASSLTRPHKWLIQKLDVLMGRWRQQAIVAVSSQLEERLQRQFPGKVRKIFNFIDVDDVRRHKKQGSRPGVEVPRIGIVGRLVPVKRVDLFLQTILLLKEHDVVCEAVVIGSGPMEPDLKRRAVELGISEQVDFKGFVSPACEEIEKLDVLLMPSDHEGLPMTLLEALALEVPIVAHQVGGIPEALNFGQCGWLVQDHSPEGYSRTLTQVLAFEPSHRAKVTADGLAYVRRLFGASVNAGRYVDVYTTI